MRGGTSSLPASGKRRTGKICRGGGKRKRAISPLNMRIRRKYKKRSKSSGKYQPTGAETRAELKERNELWRRQVRRLHDGCEKPVTAARAAQKKSGSAAELI